MTAVVTATVIASLVTPSLSLPVNFDPTVMAHIAVGEVGGWGIWGTQERAWELQAMVVWVAKNQAGCLPDDYDPRQQFYGWEEDITQEDIDRAAVVLEAPQEADPTKRALHVISEQDRIKLGFPRGDIVECGVAPFWQLHFYLVWPAAQSVDRQPELTDRRL